MYGAWTFNSLVEQLAGRIEYDRVETLPFGLLFARPSLPIAQTQIVPDVGYFHHQSADHFHLFAAGYRPDVALPQDEFRDTVPVPGFTLDDRNVKWEFSNLAYSQLVDKIQTVLKWKPSGGCELLMLAAGPSERGRITLYKRDVLAIDLDMALHDEAILSVNHLVQEIINEAKKFGSPLSAFQLSDRLAGNKSFRELRDGLLSLLPLGLGKTTKRIAHFVTESHE